MLAYFIQIIIEFYFKKLNNYLKIHIMKKRIFTLMFILAAALCGFAQDRNNEDEVVKMKRPQKFGQKTFGVTSNMV